MVIMNWQSSNPNGSGVQILVSYFGILVPTEYIRPTLTMKTLIPGSFFIGQFYIDDIPVEVFGDFVRRIQIRYRYFSFIALFCTVKWSHSWNGSVICSHSGIKIFEKILSCKKSEYHNFNLNWTWGKKNEARLKSWKKLKLHWILVW